MFQYTKWVWITCTTHSSLHVSIYQVGVDYMYHSFQSTCFNIPSGCGLHAASATVDDRLPDELVGQIQSTVMDNSVLQWMDQ